ncbi:hypothetical protein ABZ234_17680 [Nocardiopsis sp. NPDC006198]|uniref:hypothetical protein n=1 Tax=Nocardiopsis sp. NPDC006198 TaxID=3154472 RepID=UPI0033BE33C0
MKFDVVDPSDEQAILDEEAAPDEQGAEDEPLPPGVHPRLDRAARQMHTRISADLGTLGESLNRLHAHIETARSRETEDAPQAPPPTNFRAGAFSRPPSP